MDSNETDAKLMEISKTILSETSKKDLQAEMLQRISAQTGQLMDDIEHAIWDGVPSSTPEDIPIMSPEEAIRRLGDGVKTHIKEKETRQK